MTKDQAAEMVKATAAQLEEDKIAHAVGFWAAEEVDCVAKFLQANPEIAARFAPKQRTVGNLPDPMVLLGVHSSAIS